MNCCVEVYQKSIPHCLEVEKVTKANKGICSEDFTSNAVNLRSSGMDVYTFTFNKSNDITLGMEMGSIGFQLNISNGQFEAIVFLILSCHYINHRKHHGAALSVLLASITGAEVWFGDVCELTMKGKYVKCSVTYYGQVFLSCYHLGYSPGKKIKLMRY